MAFDDDLPIRPDGLGIRRRRRGRGWSRTELAAAVEVRTREATGRGEPLSRNLLRGIEEANERVAYAVVSRIALALDCNPIELVLAESPPAADPDSGTVRRPADTTRRAPGRRSAAPRGGTGM